MNVVNKLLNYKDMKIIQDTNMFSFSLDSVLIARFANMETCNNIIDIGTNNAVIPLILSRYTNARIDGIDIQKNVCEIANQNVFMNKLENKIQIINADINLYARTKNNYYDLVICNPPYFKIENSNKKNVSQEKRLARHEETLNISDLFKSVSILLNNKKDFYMIHITERFDEIIEELRKNKLFPKKVKFIYSKINQQSNRFMVHCKFNGNEGMTVEPPLIIHNEDGSYTKEVKKFFND